MIDKQVSVDFDVNGQQYAASMQQMVAATQAYSASADTMLGKLGKLSGFITNTMMKASSGLTQSNKMATAQAAAYQQKMSGLEATAKQIGEKTFPKLEKQTMKLAREFPIGIGQAVEQMESLQKSGIKAGDTMGKLATTYTKLGAATGTYAPAIGEAMTEFTRSMGNNMSMAEGFGDSLTTLTKQYGGSAQSVLAFSKSIAPIASTIGMNQAQVMGFSTAFARLGEDGFAAGNALNKVMIDLNKASRDGGPELRAYANAMGKSVEELSAQLKDSPASVLVDFTEAINKAGPDAIRTLEGLGLEGVRTVKAFTALSREGNLGEIVEQAGEAYGSGSTAKAAEDALSGVNDQMTKLSESTSQMVASAGKPFLGWLEAVLKAANGVQEVFTSIAGSGFGQALGKVGAIAGFAGGGAMTALQIGSTYALARRGGRFLKGGATKFREGREAEATGGLGEGAGWLATMGARWERTRPTDWDADRPSGRERAARAGARVGSGIRGTGNLLKDALTAGVNITASDMRTAIGKEGFESEGGRTLRRTWSESRGMAAGGDLGGGMKNLSTGLKDLARESKNTGQAFGKTTSAFKNLGLASGALAVDAARLGGKGMAAGGRGLMGLAGMAGIGPAGLAIGAAGAAAYGVYKVRQNQEASLEQAKTGMTDPYRQFNEFATKAGYATEQITLLGKASAEAAKTIADKNKTDEDAYKLSSDELAAAKAPGYKPAWEGAGGATGNVAEDAVLSFLQNQNMTQSQIALQGMDVEAQFAGKGQAFLTERQKLEGMDFGQIIEKGITTSASQRGFMGRETEDSKATMEATVAYMQQRWSTTGEQFGSEAGQRQKEEDLEQIYNRAVTASEAGNFTDATKYIQALESATGIKFDQWSTQSITGQAAGGMTGSDWKSALEEINAEGKQGAGEAKDLLDANAKRGTELKEVENKALTASKEATAAYNKATGANIDLTKTLFAGNQLAAKNGKTISELDETMLANLDETSKAVALAQKNPNQQNVGQAARAVVAEVMKQSGGDVVKAQGAIRQQLALASDDATKAILAQALGGMGSSVEVARATAGQSTIQGIQTKIRTGAQAAAIPLPENASAEAVQAQEAALAQQAEGIHEMESVYRSYLTNVRNTLIQMERQEQDMGKQRSRSQADFRLQQKYAQQDYNHSRAMAEKQFNLQMTRAEQDYLKSRARATRDFNRSMARNDQAYHRQIDRQRQDFYKQQERQAEDNAKAMYDPYQRVEHKRVWDTKQLMSNIKQQNEVLKRQMEQVDKLKASGLSQGAVDLLGLANPENAEQTAKLFGEMMNDPQMVAQMNEQVAGRIDLSKAFTLDVDNVGTRRATEDFTLSLQRAAEDYKTSVKQAREDFNTQMADMAKDYTEMKKRSREDFETQQKEMAYQFRTQRRRAQEQQRRMLARMASDAATARQRTITDLSNAADDMFMELNGLAEQTGGYIANLPSRYRTKLSTAVTTLMNEYDTALGKQPPGEMKTKFVYYDPKTGKYETSMSHVNNNIEQDKPAEKKIKFVYYDARTGKYTTSYSGPSGGGDDPLEVRQEAPPPGSSNAGPRATSDGPTAGKGHWSGNWYRYGNGSYHGGADIAVPKGTGAYSVVNGRIKDVRTLATVQDQNGSYGRYVVLTDGRHDFYYAHLSAQTVRKGQEVRKGDMVGRTGNTGHTLPIGSGYHLHFEARPAGAGHSSAISPRQWMSQGGIATRTTNAVIGEGGPELVLPLNERGAKMLAETMARYLAAGDARQAKVAPYASQVINNSTIHQDYSTTFSGPVSVEAQDPAEFARLMRQQARAKRLTQPIGAR